MHGYERTLGAPEVVGRADRTHTPADARANSEMTYDSDPENSSGARRRTDATTDHLHELADIERLLRADARATDPRVRIGDSGAGISWASAGVYEHARGSLTAAVCAEIARSSRWGLATVHDPHDIDEGTLSRLTLIHDPDTEADR
jgi:hypothetical protein